MRMKTRMGMGMGIGKGIGVGTGMRTDCGDTVTDAVALTMEAWYHDGRGGAW